MRNQSDSISFSNQDHSVLTAHMDTICKASEDQNDYTKDRFYYKRLIGNSKTNCVDVSNDLISPVAIICAPDYNVNFMNDAFCGDNTKIKDFINRLLMK